MDDFRTKMLNGGHIRHLVDYTKMSTAFPGVDFEGGVQYFLYDQKYEGPCEYTLFQGETQMTTVKRELGAYDIFIRDQEIGRASCRERGCKYVKISVGAVK